MSLTGINDPSFSPGPVIPLHSPCPPSSGVYIIINTVRSPLGQDLAVQFHGDGMPLTVAPLNRADPNQYVSSGLQGVTGLVVSITSL
ncbi:hypothetical protein BS47DRAFT_1351057 [Hydnum rufescens UP504]|uniref:Uncharacterized protein n=1 Tax=Hydnum rufescens UP504 TaxID=1448309 RepID=A0A9P6ALE7_9AGAM|nr:hypothetical protein BS47DRAFT_1351057 [Hydnum rufescens UP504]